MYIRKISKCCSFEVMYSVVVVLPVYLSMWDLSDRDLGYVIIWGLDALSPMSLMKDISHKYEW